MVLLNTSTRRHFASLKDPRRKHRRRHNLLDLLVIVLCGVIANANTFQEIETVARKRLHSKDLSRTIRENEEVGQQWRN